MKHRATALILSALATLGPFSVDTYFASFPEIASHFRVSEIEVQHTLSFYLVALAVMNLFHGALSDSFGRRKVILSCLGVYSVSALACVVAPNFTVLLVLRVIQGLAAGAGMTVGRAVIRDRFPGPDAQKTMAQVTVVAGLGPVVAPILGGWLHVWFGWRGPFAFLAFLGLALWALCYSGLAESLPERARHTFHPGRLVRSYAEALTHPPFLMLCAALSFGGGGFLIYVATAPDVVLNILSLSKTQFGWLFLPMVSGMILGSAASARTAGRMPARTIVAYGFALMAVGAILNLVVNTAMTPRIPWAVLPLPIYTFGFSLLAPVLTIQCLDLFPTRKGLASSLQGFFQIVVFALVAGVGAGLVYRSGPRHALALLLMMLISCGAYLCYTRFAPHEPHPPLATPGNGDDPGPPGLPGAEPLG